MTEQPYSGGPFHPSFGADPLGHPPYQSHSAPSQSGTPEAPAGLPATPAQTPWSTASGTGSRSTASASVGPDSSSAWPRPDSAESDSRAAGNQAGADESSDSGSPRRSAKRRARRPKAGSVASGSGAAGSGASDSSDGGDDFVWPSRRRDSDGGEEEEQSSARKTKRRGRRKRKTADEGSTAAPVEEESGSEEPKEIEAADGDDRSGSSAKKSRRRGKRGGRRRKKTGSEAEDSDGVAEADGESEGESDLRSKPRSLERSGARKRGSRGGRKRKKSAAVEVEVIPGEEDDLPALSGSSEDDERGQESPRGGGPRKRVTPSRRRNSSRVEETEEGDDAPRTRRKKTTKKAAKKTAKKTAKKAAKRTKQSKKSRSARPEGARAEEEDAYAAVRKPVVEPGKPRQILVNAADPEETRVVVVEEGRIVDLQMTAKKHVTYVSDIFRGRVVNLEPAIGAAFVDFGQGKNGFLHASDVLPCYGEPDFQLDQLLTTPVDTDDWSSSSQPDVHAELDDIDTDTAPEEDEAKGQGRRGGRGDAKKGRSAARSHGRTRRPRLPIEKLVKKGQMICAQITKDAIGDKGPTLTTYISIPGRYLVLMPSLARTGVSRKIDDDRERRRLKRILTSLKIPDGMGVIVRTAGVGRTKAELKRDLDYLLAAWEDFSKRLVSGRNPAPLYQESDVAIKTMRDLFTPNVEAVTVDDPAVHERVVEFTKKLMPEHLDRIKLHEGSRPLLQSFGVEPDFEKIFSKRVELPSGGSIVIEQTEALVAIDVNSGRTREEGAGFEDIALKTNLEAVPEIARQIRLRDLGGIIVLDYIDMMRASSRRAVERATREGLANDRARSKVGRISQFGLLELTRQRLGPGLDKLVYETCKTCRGSGRRRSASSRAQAILRRLGASLTLKGFTSVEVRAHPDAIDYLKKTLGRELERLEDESGRKIVLLAVPDQVEDSVLHYLRADGREVRPGGRRKRR